MGLRFADKRSFSPACMYFRAVLDVAQAALDTERRYRCRSRAYVVRFRPIAAVSDCVFSMIDNGCSDSWVLDGGECSQADSMGVLVNNQSRSPDIIADRKHSRFVDSRLGLLLCDLPTFNFYLSIIFIGCCSLEEQTSRA